MRLRIIKSLNFLKILRIIIGKIYKLVILMYNYCLTGGKMAVEVTIKKWGNSMGVILPIEMLEKKGLKENDKIQIEIVKEADLSHLFGTLKTGMSGQKFKDMVRKGWN